MEKVYDELLGEQRKTNALLTQLLQEQTHKRRQETRRFWVGTLWQVIPLIIIGIMLWLMYQYVHTQVDLFQNKFSEIQSNIGSFNLGNQLKSFL